MVGNAILQLVFILAAIGIWLFGAANWVGLPVLAAMGITSLYLRDKPSLQNFNFTIWVFVFVAAAMFYPSWFIQWGSFELKVLIIPLIQLIMFGMGTTLSVGDFLRVLSMPRAVLIGMVLQFTVMPLVGALIALTFGFSPEIAAGIVLVGSCPGGVASNVMTYISKGNVALSVTMTACSTLLSPIMTPLMMKWLGGQYIEIVFYDMMITIIQIIIVPIGAGLIVNKLLEWMNLRGAWMDRWLSIMAMSAICFILGIIISLSRDQLLTVGFLLIGASIVHNGAGYLLGYWGARILSMDESSCRTVSIEVGLQNGGMATGLALNVLHSIDASLAPAIFGVWMNISGSVLASWWRRKPLNQTD